VADVFEWGDVAEGGGPDPEEGAEEGADGHRRFDWPPPSWVHPKENLGLVLTSGNGVSVAKPSSVVGRGNFPEDGNRGCNSNAIAQMYTLSILLLTLACAPSPVHEPNTYCDSTIIEVINACH